MHDEQTRRPTPAAALVPPALDVALPLGAYYLLYKALGVDLVTALALSSVPPALRLGYDVVRNRRFNTPAMLMITVNVAGVVLSFVSGDARIMMAMDSGVNSVIGLSILLSALAGRPLMSYAIKPFLTRGDPARLRAWDRLSADSARFRRAERAYSLVWGTALLAECVIRIVGAFSLPVSTMIWLSNVILGCALAVAFVAGGFATHPMERLLRSEATAS